MMTRIAPIPAAEAHVVCKRKLVELLVLHLLLVVVVVVVDLDVNAAAAAG